ncbi:MAG: hypothetical protein GY801_18100 [bacterium]|nr:hypothetical protein [bacterium]
MAGKPTSLIERGNTTIRHLTPLSQLQFDLTPSPSPEGRGEQDSLSFQERGGVNTVDLSPGDRSPGSKLKQAEAS